MDADEREIFNYLKTWGSTFVGAAEICRRATTKRRAHAEPDWAKPVLISMKNRGILEGDSQGRYRIKPHKKKKVEAPPSDPAAEEAPPEGGPEVENPAADLAPDEYYEQL